VEQVYDGMLAKACEDDLARRTDRAAGVERALIDAGEANADFAATSEDAVKSVSTSFEGAFKGFMTGAKAAGDVFTGLADTILEQLARIASQQLLSPLTDSLFGLLGGLFGFAKGAVFDAPGASEAVMPLRRDSAGRLGVNASGLGGGSPVTVTVIDKAPGTEARALPGLGWEVRAEAEVRDA
jgi:hypothetical protein